MYLSSAIIKLHSCNPTQVVSNSPKGLSRQMPTLEDDEPLYLAGQTNTIKPAGKISIREDCMYHLSFKKPTINKQKNSPVLQVYISKVTCNILHLKKKSRRLFQRVFLMVRKIEGENRKP